MNERERRRAEQLRADERAVRAAADRVRAAAGGNLAALSEPHVADRCGQLLDDVLAEASRKHYTVATSSARPSAY